MTAFTAYLDLYLPGGGSLGIGGDDEALDVDRLNQNFQKIDVSNSSLNDRVTVVEGKTAGNVQFSGPKADRASVTGMKRGDTYQETDEKFDFWEYTNAWRMRTPHIVACLTSTTALTTGNVVLSWTDSVTAHFVDTGEFWASGQATRVNLKRVGWYRVSIGVRTNGTAAFTGQARLNGTDLPYTTVSGDGVSGSAASGTRTFMVKAINDTRYLDFEINGGNASGNHIVTVEYLGDL